MKLFEKLFLQQLSENSAGAGGVFGGGSAQGFESMGHGGAMTPAVDFYAHDDARTPMPGKKKKKNKKSNAKKKDGSIQPLIPLQRRPFNTTM
jgi:hypothetical protein